MWPSCKGAPDRTGASAAASVRIPGVGPCPDGASESRDPTNDFPRSLRGAIEFLRACHLDLGPRMCSGGCSRRALRLPLPRASVPGQRQTASSPPFLCSPIEVATLPSYAIVVSNSCTIRVFVDGARSATALPRPDGRSPQPPAPRTSASGRGRRPTARSPRRGGARRAERDRRAPGARVGVPGLRRFPR